MCSEKYTKILNFSFLRQLGFEVIVIACVERRNYAFEMIGNLFDYVFIYLVADEVNRHARLSKTARSANAMNIRFEIWLSILKAI